MPVRAKASSVRRRQLAGLARGEAAGDLVRREMAAGAGIERGAVGVGADGSGGDLGARAEAGIEQAGSRAACRRRRHSSGKRCGLEPDGLFPAQPKPAQIRKDRVGEFRLAAGGVDILDAQQERPPMRSAHCAV